MEHTIWSNANLNFSEWRKSLLEELPDASDYELERLMYELNDEYLEDEKMNLDVQLDRPILMIADLGLWNGRKSGYKEIQSGNIRDCFVSVGDYVTWYVNDNGDFCCDDTHHDGTNHYRYRTYKKNASERQIEGLKAKLYDGTATEADINKVTVGLGKKIAAVYGWKN